MEYQIPVNRETKYKVILTILNFNLGLSDLEMDIVCAMLTNNWLEINPDTKEAIRKNLDKDKYNTNNYIKRLKDKGVLLPKGDSRLYDLNPNIIELVKDHKISFEFVDGD